MRVIGFGLNRILAEKAPDFKRSNPPVMNVEFISLDKEEVEILKDQEAVKIGYKYSLIYNDQDSKKESKVGEISFEGNIIIAIDKEESREIMKSWKKKSLPDVV